MELPQLTLVVSTKLQLYLGEFSPLLLFLACNGDLEAPSRIRMMWYTFSLEFSFAIVDLLYLKYELLVTLFSNYVMHSNLKYACIALFFATCLLDFKVQTEDRFVMLLIDNIRENYNMQLDCAVLLVVVHLVTERYRIPSSSIEI